MSYFLNKTGKELFQKHIEQYTPPDPLYEYNVDPKGKKKRSKRQVPPGLSERDAKILKSIQTRAHHLDKGFNICGLRFGWSFLIALIPLAGSVADAFLSYTLIIRKARKADIPAWLEMRMIFNSAVAVGASFVPLVGDVVLAVWKANSRNAVLLEEFLRIRGEEWLRQQAEQQQALDEQNKEKEGGGPVATAPKEKKKGWAGLLRWRGVDESNNPGSGMQTGERSQSSDEDQYSPPAPVGDGSMKKKVGGFFNSRGKESEPSQFHDMDDAKAPPAGEKGRFVEHVPEAEHQQLWSPPK